MSNTTKLANMLPRPVLRRSYNETHIWFHACEIQRIVRGAIARRRLRPGRLLRSTNEHELTRLELPVLLTPNHPMLSPIMPSPPPVYRLTREDERRLVTDEDLDEAIRRLEEEFEANYL